MNEPITNDGGSGEAAEANGRERPRGRRSGSFVNSLILLAIVVLLVYLLPALVGEKGGNGVVKWRTDFEIATREANQSGRPMLVEFTASWCPPCQKMKKVVWTNERVADEANAKFVPVMVDVDEQAKVAGYYGVDSVPLVMIMREGKVTYYQSGYHDAAKVLEVMAK
jgi:thiol-disulfide isomerase/thioredoxin